MTVLITTTVVASGHEGVDVIDGVALIVILCFRSQADAASDRSRAIKAVHIEVRIST